MPDHTPTPWADLQYAEQGMHAIGVDGSAEDVIPAAFVPEATDAAFIVQAVNAHDALVAERTTLIAAIAYAECRSTGKTQQVLRAALDSTLGKDSA